ncbi:MAG: regulatory protein RecX [Oscillospiraceae bacterium]
MILSIKSGRANKIHIYIDDEYKLTVDRDYWFSEKWRNKKEISDEELTELTAAVNSRRAFNAGLDLLSRRSHGKIELVKKLSVKHTKEAALAAVERIEELGLINDERFAELYADELYRRKGFSVSRIKRELILKGIDREIAENVAETLDKDDINRIIILLQTKYSRYLSDEKGIKRATNALIRLGYNYYDIKKAFHETEISLKENEYE